jgi:cyclopropane-fatty-acyl-phospholipid synthase
MIKTTTTQSRSKAQFESLFFPAGIAIGGTRPWDVRVHDHRFFDRVMAHGTLGLGEAYMEGWWDCDALDEFFARALRARLEEKVTGKTGLLLAALEAKFRFRDFAGMGTVKRHYDLGNDLYRAMLDKRMVYTCAYWKDAHNLDEAQEAKLDLVCRKLGLQPGMRVLDIGCGWGSFVKFAAERYGVKATGITIAEKQAELAREMCRGLPVEIVLQDYRDMRGEFDRIVSLGMFEHVGVRNYRLYMEAAHRCLAEGGLFLLHTMGANQTYQDVEPWIVKYIFPDSMIPSISQVGSALENLFVMEDWHNLSTDYDRTLCSWHGNFERAWPQLKGNAYDETFRRMWNYYLLLFAASFRARKNQLWQMVLSKNPQSQYQSIR